MTDNTLPNSREWEFNGPNGELSFETEGGYTARLVPDQFPEDPRTECDPLGTLYVPSSNRSISGDKGADDPNDLEPGEIAVLLPVYVLDHSVVRVSVSDFGDPWDSGCAGAIYLTRKTVKREYGWDRLTKQRKAKLAGYLKGEIQALNDYLSGEVCGLIVTDRDGEEIENVWGFYPDHEGEIQYGSYLHHVKGSDRWATVIAEAQSAIDHHIATHTINPAFAGVGL